MNQNETIKQAIKLLQAGEVIAIPTETVYGLAADASNESAVKKIFELKRRPADHPVIVHIADASKLSAWAIDLPEVATRLAREFWPGPLTLILKKNPEVPLLVTGGQNTIGLRSPSHPITHELLKQFGGGLAAPSANRFGKLSPTKAQHVIDTFQNEIPLIIDGGHCEVGIESTILDLSGERPRLLRPGMISIEQIETIIRQPILCPDRTAPRVSGSLPAHYAPQTKATLVNSSQLINFISNNQSKIKLAVLSFQPLPKFNIPCAVIPKNPKQYAQQLYLKLHELDQCGVDLIVIENIPDTPEWKAIQDRLQRAAH